MRQLFFTFLEKFGAQQKFKLLLLMFGAILAGLIEVTGMMLLFPLIALVNDASIIETNIYLFEIYEFLKFKEPRHMVYFLGASIGIIFILKNLYMIYFHYAQLSFLKKWRDELANVVMTKYLKTPYKFHLNRSSNEIINTLNYTVYYSLNMFMLPAINFVSCILISLILLGFVMFMFFWASVVSGAVLLITTYTQSQILKRATNKINTEANKTRAFNLSILSQSIGAIKETKAFNKEHYFNKRFVYSNGRVSEFDRRAVFLQLIPMYITEMALILTIIVMMMMVLSEAYSPVDGLTSLAILAAVAFRIAPIINRALGAYSQMRIAFEATKELLYEVESLEKLEIEKYDEDNQSRLEFNKTIKLDNVSYEYTKDIHVLKDVSLEISKGEFIGIVGASGAGKTTLIDVLLGLLKPSFGSYKIDNTEINTETLIGLRRLMGYVSQNPYIFNADIRENVAYGIPPEEIDDERVEQVLKLAQLSNHIKSLEKGIYAKIGDDGKGLSGGQKQRLAIARALYNNPEVIVLDEATSSLDVETEHEITQVIQKLKGEKTIIAIAHRLSTLKECDRILFMEHGELKDTGTFKQLSKKHKGFARILALSSIDNR